ncbi:hypothetical protein PBOI14_33540 [Pseudomonas sp. Boi14]|nr:hypothetical protein PBOI14_33540 [Pseudomonas sp. Boi14]
MLNGVYRFDAGTIVFERQPLQRIDPLDAARRGIGRTFQNNALFKKMSVLDNLLTGLSRHSRARFIEQALGLPGPAVKPGHSASWPRASCSFWNCRHCAMCRWATWPMACKSASSWAGR